ncbi:Alpha/Beta hydrolase protein [Aspergillus pseudonomiae]|uniref:Alpha/Beta hydrolase protein n=1 Tax=Aspergillus pseudonomiae TaxID=1506151 RepID=A0A5N7DBN3_9EURO|nr:Alpha/Beta hydrolase protein [Aspergillus pseudonomiae]KAE8403801.1 Alpha/Beta hydrolase protein [Aspergillus pseudonomiae]
MARFWGPIISISMLVAALPASSQQVSIIQPVGASVWTSSGLIEGHTAPQRSNVSEYLGIPYATPPTGDLRFARPVAHHSNSTVRASTYSPDCPANIGTTPDDYPGFSPQAQKIIQTFAQQLGTPQSEDCLYLNVWTRPATSALKPVLVFIHGGRFSLGGAHSPYYDGQILADEQEVVVVTFNYRLNIFGFSGAPRFPQNVALLDQRLAVEWVHRNIQAFGGDPNRITIFGQSAGGASVDYYSYIWTEKPLVSGLISHSGTALSFKPNTPEESASYFYHVSRTLGCGNSTTNTNHIIQCLRQQPYKSILKAVAKVPTASSPVLPQPVFHPTVDNITIFDDYAQRSATGNFSRIPYLVTSNANEAGYYRVSAYAANISHPDPVWDLFNQAAFTCPTGQTAAHRAAAGVPVWQSRYFGDWENLRLYASSGAYHGIDLPMVFGTASKISGIADSKTEREFARYMASAWAAFAGDPVHGLSRFGWPRYDESGETLVGLAYGNSTGARFFVPSSCNIHISFLLLNEMADFSEYTTPHEEWLELEKSLPDIPKGLSIEQLKAAANRDREAMAAKAMVEEGLVSQVSMQDYTIPTRDGESLEARTYRPSSVPATQRLPVFIFYHGGGFVMGTLSSEDAICSRIVVAQVAAGSPVVVVNVNYRHTPEYTYPTAWNDAEDSFHWVHDHIGDIGGEAENVVVGGISAGAYLAASLTLGQNIGEDVSLAQRPKVRGQVLMIPALVTEDCYASLVAQLRDPSVSSYVECEHAPILPVSRMRLFGQLLKPEVNGSELGADRRINPGLATADEVKGLPPTTFGIAGRDPLRDEGLLFAMLLAENG